VTTHARVKNLHSILSSPRLLSPNVIKIPTVRREWERERERERESSQDLIWWWSCSCILRRVCWKVGNLPLNRDGHKFIFITSSFVSVAVDSNFIPIHIPRFYTDLQKTGLMVQYFGTTELRYEDVLTINALKTKRICFTYELSPYRAVNTLHFGYKNQSLNVL
jgi:hypothetical protein